MRYLIRIILVKGGSASFLILNPDSGISQFEFRIRDPLLKVIRIRNKWRGFNFIIVASLVWADLEVQSLEAGQATVGQLRVQA